MEEKKSGIKKFLEEFKAFAMRGNVLDMAVGVVIGGAFTAIVTALVEDIINPLIGLFFKADFSYVVIGLGSAQPLWRSHSGSRGTPWWWAPPARQALRAFCAGS